ncbi:MAG: CHAD domain-containing protein [Caldilineaceae bacterium]
MEIEAKFAILSPRQFQELVKARRLFDYPLGKAHTAQTTDIYFDTASYQLLRHGFSLRLRHTGVWLTTLKSLNRGGDETLHSRMEQEEALADDFDYHTPQPLAIQQLPSTIQRIVALAIGPQCKSGSQSELQPLCQLVQERTKRALLDPSSSVSAGKQPEIPIAESLAEVSIDQVQVNDLNASSQPVATFAELEIELRRGSAAQLSALSLQLATNPALRLNSESKFARAMQLLLPEQKIAVTMPAAEYCRTIWLKQLLLVLLQEDGVRCNNVEAVHDMRVAIRRIRAGAQLFGDQFRKFKIKPFLKSLRRTARLLGQVRDLDVALQRLHEEQGALEDGDALALLRDRWQQQRTAVHCDLIEWFNSNQYNRFVRKFLRFCQTSGVGAKALPKSGEAPLPPYQLSHLLPLLLMERFTTVRAFESLLLEEDEIPLHTWHALRIECKYLRYALEFAAPFLDKEGASLIGHLKQLQEDLGKLNDAAVSQQMLATHKDHSGAFVAYQSRQHEIIVSQIEHARRSYVDFVAPAQRRLFQQALAKL